MWRPYCHLIRPVTKIGEEKMAVAFEWGRRLEEKEEKEGREGKKGRKKERKRREGKKGRKKEGKRREGKKKERREWTKDLPPKVKGKGVLTGKGVLKYCLSTV